MTPDHSVYKIFFWHKKNFNLIRKKKVTVHLFISGKNWTDPDSKSEAAVEWGQAKTEETVIKEIPKKTLEQKFS